MAFCIREKQFVDTGYTAVENKFFINYMPEAPDKCVAVYLLGLTLSQSDGDDNSRETVAAKLNLSEEEVIAAFRYWEELGLVTVLDGNPPQILYHTLRNNAGTLKKIKPSKYARFSANIQSVIEGRMITPHEYDAYYTFLEDTTFQPEALVYVAKYCAELKGKDISYQYILTVARNQLIKGATTLAAVTDNLSSQQKYDDDLKIVFKAIKSNRHIDYRDRVYYEKWSRDYGFALDVICAVAKTCEKGGMDRLDAKLSEYYRKGALSVKEIEDYETEKTRLYDLARATTKAIGVYYQSLDSVVEEYIVPWLRRGYDDETLLAVARYCFRSGIRTLNGVASIIDKLYKNGVVNLASLEEYLDELAMYDDKIQTVLRKCGLARATTSNDRVLYRTWTDQWHMPQELIDYAAELAAGKKSPLSYVNTLLADFKQHGISTAEQAADHRMKFALNTAATAQKAIIGADIQRRHYTDEQIMSLFTALDESED